MIPTLRLYALLADGERGALIGPSGEIAWMCMPSWDGEGVFNDLLGGRGTYFIKPEGRFVWGGYYESGTLIWRSRWMLGEGSILESRDALAFPGDPECAVLLRRITPLKGSSKVCITLDLWKAFGDRRLDKLKLSEDGVWTADSEGLHARWTGGAKAIFREDTGLVMELELREGREYDLALELSTKAFSGPPPNQEDLWKATKTSWLRSMPQVLRCAAERDVRHAYAVLRGLTASSGGMVAGATTSLPERAESTRDYDYRFVWILDQCWMGQGIAAHGPHPMLESTCRFVGERILCDGPDLRPAYTSYGRPIPAPRTMENLPGYPGTLKVVVGNQAGSQFQLDVFGEILLLFATAAEKGMLDADGWKVVEVAADAIDRNRRRRDSGVWELDNRHWVHSKLMCAAGLRRIAQEGAPLRSASRWLALADAITADAGVTGVHRSGRWKRARDDDRVDASLLLPTLRGAVDLRDPRSLATPKAIEEELVQDGYCHRYRTTLPLGEGEGAFTVCNFWLALTHFRLGNKVRATHLFERARSSCGPPGLFTEEYDVAQRELRGNFPQAFVHAFLLECAGEMGEEIETERGIEELLES